MRICECCAGLGKVTGMGCMREECKNCSGKGFFKDSKAEEAAASATLTDDLLPKTKRKYVRQTNIAQ